MEHLLAVSGKRILLLQNIITLAKLFILILPLNVKRRLILGRCNPNTQNPPIASVGILPIVFVTFRTATDDVQDQDYGENHSANSNGNVKWSKITN